MRPPPGVDPISGKNLIITELSTEDGEVSIRGKFELPRYTQLDEEATSFLETFLRCRGVITSMERELSLSYPTVVKRLDALLQSLGLTAVKDAARRVPTEKGAEILDLLEQGQIDAQEAKRRISEEKTENHV